MSRFKYQALDANGRLTSGEVEAADVQAAIGELHQRGLQIQSISLAPNPMGATPGASDIRTSRAHGDRQRQDGEGIERTVLWSHMAMILERGGQIAPALRAYADELRHGWQRRQLLEVCTVLERRNPTEAANALVKLPECWIPLLSAATASSDPGQILREFLAESRRADDLRQKSWLSLAYPIVLAVLAAVVMTALSVFVIPQFRSIFREFNLRLPAITQLMLNTYSFLSIWGIVIILASLVALTIVVLKANRFLPNVGIERLADWLHLPLGRRTAIARFTRFTADLLEAGVQTPDALRIAGFTADRARVKHAAWRLANDLAVSGTFSRQEYEPPLTAFVALALSSETPVASRVRLLRDASNSYSERVHVGQSWTAGIIEPLAICVVGAIVGMTVIGLFMPLISLIQNLSK